MDFTQQLLRNHGFSFWRVGFSLREAKKAKEEVIYEAKEIKDVEKLFERAKNGESDLP